MIFFHLNAHKRAKACYLNVYISLCIRNSHACKIRKLYEKREYSKLCQPLISSADHKQAVWNVRTLGQSEYECFSFKTE